ncbi:cytochrome c [Pseudomonas sp. FP2300]|uniref:c-type cytochrome n=1 Tax=Pseudomonas sp. FP2300 TaxID=2954090 RepID=UPI002732CC4B|nr:cytochrome c [Pseudomonas sp. FP2300]WLH65171.1 cytochrome c [Pseudomonas sp. FP2300]
MIYIASLSTLVVAMLTTAVQAADTPPGKHTYERWCATCHAAGDDFPGTVALRAKYKGAVPDVLIERQDLSPDLIKYFVRNGVSIMPTFRKTEISDVELNELANFLTKAKQ